MVFVLYRVLQYVSPPIDQYLKFKNQCSLMSTPNYINTVQEIGSHCIQIYQSVFLKELSH